jgi:hypothetical protein
LSTCSSLSLSLSLPRSAVGFLPRLIRDRESAAGSLPTSPHFVCVLDRANDAVTLPKTCGYLGSTLYFDT